MLEQAQREASGTTVAEYARLLQARSDALRLIRDDVHGIELTTIHRAKGRQWPEVHLFGCEESEPPHRRALEVSEQQRAAGEGLEAERRLAYVAFTRAQERLVVHTTATAASRFLSEAGLDPARPYGLWAHRRPARARPPHSEDLPERIGTGPVATVLTEAVRVGLAYALRNAPTRSVALEAAATAVERRLIGPATASSRMSVTALLAAVEQLQHSERAGVLEALGAGSGDTLAGRLSAGARQRLVDALRALASGSSSRDAPASLD